MPSRTPRRQRLRADERREQIIRATTEVIATRGYAHATLTAIAETADVAKGLLWHYFDDRDDLMRQAVTHLAQQLRVAVVADLELTAPVPDVMRAILTRTAMFTRTHGAELETIDQIVHNWRTPDGQQRLTMIDYEDTYAEYEMLMTRGQSDGSIRRANARVMAVTLQGVIDAMIGYLQAHPDVDPKAHAAQVAELFLSGAAAAPSPASGTISRSPDRPYD